MPGLGTYRKQEEAAQRIRDEERGIKVPYAKIKDGQTLKVRPLQELDEDAKNFIPECGTAEFAKIWRNPDDYRKALVDTTDTEGRCWPQEHSWEPTGERNDDGSVMLNARGRPRTFWDARWRPKEVMFINLLVDDGENQPHVVVAEWSINEKATQGPALINCHDANGTITNRWFLWKRKGTGIQDTVHTFTAMDPDDSLPSTKEYELHDLSSIVPHVPYAKQREYMLGSPAPEHVETAAPPANVVNSSQPW